MSEAVKLKYHQRTFDLLGLEPHLNPEAPAILDQFEHEHNFKLPASVREWYELEGAVSLLREYSHEDHPSELHELAQDVKDSDNGKLLIFMVENQACALWAINLDGSDDPPVVVDHDENVWRYCADNFSSFIYTQVWDMQLWDDAQYWEDDFIAFLCQEKPLSSEEFQFLKENFEELPKRSHFSDEDFRFSNGNGKRILITVDRPNQYHEQWFCTWHIWADSEENLVELIRSVWQCGTLAADLRSAAASGESEYGERVLEALRGN